ncbi:MAG: hypothetical protein WBL40_12920 [Terrimicrobiaceae bacterium]
MALRIKGKGSVFQDVPVTGALSQALLEWKEIQELLRHKNIRTTVRYTHVGHEQTRQTAEALSQALE